MPEKRIRRSPTCWPARTGWAPTREHQLRRRQHLREGQRTDPVTGEEVELLWVKGSGGDLGTLTGAGLAVLRLDRLRALATCTRAWSARTRWSRRSTTACTARAGRPRPSTPRCTGWSSRARRSPAPGLRHRAGHGGRRGELTARVLRRQGGVGAVAPARVRAGPGHRRDQGGAPAGHRRACWAGTVSPPGATPARSAKPTHCGSSAPPSEFLAERGGPSRSAPVVAGCEALPEAERRAKAAALFPTSAGIASHGPAGGRPLHRLRRVLDFLARAKLAAAGRARHLVPRPLPAHQGQAAGAGPAADAPSRRSSRG